MKYLTPFRDPDTARALAEAIASMNDPARHYRLMEFCGGHTHTLHRYGIPALLPSNIEMVHGPGCPVCVLPAGQIDKAIQLAKIPGVMLCSYGDMLRVPGSRRHTLLQARAEGADIRMVYSAEDALSLAITHPDREVVFFAIGFETTTPPTAQVLTDAKARCIPNFSVFCNHVLTPVAMQALLETQDAASVTALDGFVGPAHVSIVTGSKAYDAVSARYQKPVVIAGFEPLDMLHAILMLLRQIREGRHAVEVQYTRAVTRDGNRQAQALVERVFRAREQFAWRGLGMIPQSALCLAPEFAAFDAEKRFTLQDTEGREHPGCACANVLRGLQKPTDCALFAVACTPENPLGACMVSSEGACSAVYAYDRRSRIRPRETL